MSDYEQPYDTSTPMEEAYLAEQQFDEEIAQDYSNASSLGEEVLSSPSVETDEQLASELGDNAMSNFEDTMGQAEQFDATLNE